jgi:ElaB/YqjD/DUF883 family membrane-anchored ribosome-binding protein
MGISKIGKVSLDGTKIKANASKHKALSYGYAQKLEKQLEDEINSLMKKAQTTDDLDEDTGMSIPKELAIRKDLLQAIKDTKKRIEQRAQERYEKEKSTYDTKIKKREEKEKSTGKKPGGRVPKEPNPEPLAKDQINLTDEESRIMPTSGKGFDQCYNAQASVDIQTMLIVGSHITNATNDKQQIDPAIDELNKLPVDVAQIEDLLADTGYDSEYNVKSCIANNINPLIARKRDKHHPSPEERFKEPEPLNQGATDIEKARTFKSRCY